MCRFALGQWLNRGGHIPWGTFAANVLSCIILGALITMVSKDWLSPHFRLLLLTGFCGGFSTFSTFSAELFLLLEKSAYGMAALYAGGSLLAGLLALLLGMMLMR